MLNKRIIPVLLLKNDIVVKTIQFQNPRPIGEPIYAIKIFNDYEVDELIIVDIMLSKNNTDSPSNPMKKKIPLTLISKISDESCMPITYGGGIDSLDDVNLLFNAGVEKIAINSSAVTNSDIVRQISKEYGSQSVVISIDVKQNTDNSYNVFTHCGTKSTNLDPIAHAIQMQTLGAGEILINSIDRDGMMNGYDISLIKKMSSSVTIPVIALGGAGSYEHLHHALQQGGASAVAAGSMFVYFGKKKAILINYPDRSEIEKILDS